MCNLPFIFMEVFQAGAATCCPSWNKIGVVEKEIKGVWNSEEFCRARKEIQEGNKYAYCREICPNYYKQPSRTQTALEHIRLSFDETCNIMCQTCRPERIVTDQEFVQERFDQIRDCFGETLKGIELSGSGDPIASPVFRKWLLNFKREDFPKLQRIHLHTNALLLTEKFWNQLPEEVQRMIRTIDISVDAATKETYEKIRRGGSWDTLQENLNFLKTLNKQHTFCFVIQQDNYTQIWDFYVKFKEMFGFGTKILYQQVFNWGRISEEEFKRQDVFSNEECREELRRQLLKVVGRKDVYFSGEIPESLNGVKRLI